MSEIYDVIILGAGPAGLAAGLYAGRSRLNVLIIEKGQDGGQIAITDEIENYPGQIVEGESGPSLIARMTEQAEKFGAKSEEHGADISRLVLRRYGKQHLGQLQQDGIHEARRTDRSCDAQKQSEVVLCQLAPYKVADARATEGT